MFLHKNILFINNLMHLIGWKYDLVVLGPSQLTIAVKAHIFVNDIYMLSQSIIEVGVLSPPGKALG